MQDESKRKIFKYLLVFFVLAFFVLLIIDLWPDKKLPIYTTYRKNDSFPTLNTVNADTGNPVIFNGRNYIEYDPVNSLTTALLSDNQFYPTVLGSIMSPNRKYIIIRGSELGSADILSQTIGELVDEFRVDNGLYFLLDVEAETYTYLDYSYSQIFWKNDSSGFYFTDIEGPGVYFFTLNDKSISKISDDSSWLFMGERGSDLLFSRPNNNFSRDLITYNPQTKAETTLIENELYFSVLSPDQRYSATVIGSNDDPNNEYAKGILKIIDLDSGEALLEVKGISKFGAVWSNDSRDVYLNTYDENGWTIFKTEDKTRYKLELEGTKNDSDDNDVGESGRTTYGIYPISKGFILYGTDGWGTYYTFSETDPNLFNPVANIELIKQRGLNGRNYSLTYLTSSRRFLLTPISLDQNRDLAYDDAATDLAVMGIDINFLKVVY